MSPALFDCDATLGDGTTFARSVNRLSGHGLRRIAETSRASLSAYRIDTPSILRPWVLMAEWLEIVISCPPEACRAARATASRSRRPVGVRALTELGFADAFQAA